MEAATRLFGIHGYHGVSVRMIAKEAKVNLAAVGYHYGGKPGLYQAIIQDIVQVVQAGPPAFDSRFYEALKNIQSREELAVFTDKFIQDFIMLLIGKEDHLWAVFIMQNETHNPTDQFDVLFEQIGDPVMGCFCALVAAAGDSPVGTEENHILAFSLCGMCLHFVKGHPYFLQRAGWQRYEEKHAGMIGSLVSNQILRCLGLPPIQG